METKARKLSLRSKILINLVILFTILTAAYVAISYFEFKDYTVRDCVDYAKGLCSLIEDELDAEHIDDYIEKGFDYPGYTEIRARLSKLRDAYPDIVFLYVYQIREDGCHVVFDLDTDDVPAKRRERLSSLTRATGNTFRTCWRGRKFRRLFHGTGSATC